MQPFTQVCLATYNNKSRNLPSLKVNSTGHTYIFLPGKPLDPNFTITVFPLPANMSWDMKLPPELLSDLMEYLGSQYRGRAFLFQALLVNWLWFAAASRVLWRVPPVSALAKVREDERQKYATHIRQLYFKGNEDRALHSIFRNLRFPQLRYIDIDHVLFETEQFLPLGQYIQGQLKHFKFCGYRAVEDVVDLLTARCPNLESVDLGFKNRWRPSSEYLIRFFDDKSLKSICINHHMTESVDRKLVAYLSSYNSLEKLTLWTPLDTQRLNGAFNPNEYIHFPNLRYLDLQINVSYIPQLVKSIQPTNNLIELHLTAEGDSVNPLPHVCELKSLKVLCIHYLRPAQWPVIDILALTGLPYLFILRITSLGVLDTNLECPQLTDQTFAYVLQSKQFLRELVFEVRSNLTVEAIVCLGMYCRQLRVCQLSGLYDLRRFWLRDNGRKNRLKYIRSILFPWLENLRLTRIVPAPKE